MFESNIVLAVITSAIVFTAFGFTWGFRNGFTLGTDLTVEVLAKEGYVKHETLENGELKLYKLNEEK